MSALAKAFAEAAVRERDSQWLSELGEVARRAIFPWDLGKVTVYIDDGERSHRTIWIEFEKFRDLPFKYKFDEWVMMQAFDPQAYLRESMRLPLFEHLRYRPSLPVDDHIVLGED